MFIILQFIPRTRGKILERLGYIDFQNPNNLPVIHFHGASLGDVKALIPLGKTIKDIAPFDIYFHLTVMTKSGYEVGKNNNKLFNSVSFIPLDFPYILNKFFKKLNPQCLILEYTELWPNFIKYAYLNKSKIYLNNARFSRERYKNYNFVFKIFGHLYNLYFEKIFLRDNDEILRAKDLGIDDDILMITGNTKFDIGEKLTLIPKSSFQDELNLEKLKELDFELIQDPNKTQIITFGSTHSPEEKLIFDVYKELKLIFPNLKIIIAPRHEGRFKLVKELINDLNYEFNSSFVINLRSELNSLEEAINHLKIKGDILILNSYNELNFCFKNSEIVFIGGSFCSRGGHNILEPALEKKTILFGPNMRNVDDTVKILLGRGALQCSTPEELKKHLLFLLKHPNLNANLGEWAFHTLQEAMGASEKNSQVILSSISKD